MKRTAIILIGSYVMTVPGKNDFFGEAYHNRPDF
jgi:hypothetical protein